MQASSRSAVRGMGHGHGGEVPGPPPRMAGNGSANRFAGVCQASLAPEPARCPTKKTSQSGIAGLATIAMNRKARLGLSHTAVTMFADRSMMAASVFVKAARHPPQAASGARSRRIHQWGSKPSSGASRNPRSDDSTQERASAR